MKKIILFDLESWETRNIWWNGTQHLFGIRACLTNIFPVLFWVFHPICAWKQRNMYLEIPEEFDKK